MRVLLVFLVMVGLAMVVPPALACEPTRTPQPTEAPTEAPTEVPPVETPEAPVETPAPPVETPPAEETPEQTPEVTETPLAPVVTETPPVEMPEAPVEETPTPQPPEETAVPEVTEVPVENPTPEVTPQAPDITPEDSSDAREDSGEIVPIHAVTETVEAADVEVIEGSAAPEFLPTTGGVRGNLSLLVLPLLGLGLVGAGVGVRHPSVINSFSEAYRFLSNFHPAPVTFDGVKYATVEHAYQAAKLLHPVERATIRAASTPGEAKRLARHLTVRPDWLSVRVSVMEDLVWQKFQNPKLKRKLLKTEDATLIEGNTWGDEFWGVCNGHGQNNLGMILMAVRRRLQQERK